MTEIPTLTAQVVDVALDTTHDRAMLDAIRDFLGDGLTADATDSSIRRLVGLVLRLALEEPLK